MPLSRVTNYLESLGSWLIDLVTRGRHAVVDFCAYLIEQWDDDCETYSTQEQDTMPYGYKVPWTKRRRSSGHITEAQTELIEELLMETDTTLESVMELLGLMFLGDDISQLGFDDASDTIDYLLQVKRDRDT